MFYFPASVSNIATLEGLVAKILADDAGAAPGCVFGTNAWHWAPVAAAYAMTLAYHEGVADDDPDVLDMAIGQVVNTTSYSVMCEEILADLDHPLGRYAIDESEWDAEYWGAQDE